MAVPDTSGPPRIDLSHWKELVSRAGGVPHGAKFVRRFTTNLPVEDCLAEDALVAITHDGEPISLHHGGPARLIIPRLYAWKSAKWLSGLEFLPADQQGFRESNGYHRRGDPWAQERHSW